jgi:UDPglucose 6-dehydrogenase
MLQAGKAPIYEPGIEEMLEAAIASGRLHFTESCEEAARTCEIVFIAVGTPEGPDGSPDMTAVRAVAKELAQGVVAPLIVVNKSTVPVGTAQMVNDVMVAFGADQNLIEVVSCPEFLREGTAVKDALNPDRIVIGSRTRAAAEKVASLYKDLPSPVHITDTASAEMIKYASNCFLATKISFINAISRICELCDADVAEVAKGMGMDERIGSKFLNAGLGWGGSCLPKDVSGLQKISEKLGYEFELLSSVVNINDDQTASFMRRLEARIGGFEGKTIGILGLAFKPNTDDMRDAKSLVMIEQILAKGGKVRAFDPVSMENCKAIQPRLTYCPDGPSVAEGADALVIATEWAEFKDLPLTEMGKKLTYKVLFDGRRLLGADLVLAAGLEYHTIGAPSRLGT